MSSLLNLLCFVVYFPYIRLKERLPYVGSCSFLFILYYYCRSVALVAPQGKPVAVPLYLIVVRFVQPLNDVDVMLVTDSGIVISVRLVHPLNAFPYIAVMPSSIVIPESAIQFEHEFLGTFPIPLLI